MRAVRPTFQSARCLACCENLKNAFRNAGRCDAGQRISEGRFRLRLPVRARRSTLFFENIKGRFKCIRIFVTRQQLETRSSAVVRRLIRRRSIVCSPLTVSFFTFYPKTNGTLDGIFHGQQVVRDGERARATRDGSSPTTPVKIHRKYTQDTFFDRPLCLKLFVTLFGTRVSWNRLFRASKKTPNGRGFRKRYASKLAKGPWKDASIRRARET